MKTCVHIWYLTEFFLEWEMFQSKAVEKSKAHILCSVAFSPKIVPFMRYVSFIYSVACHTTRVSQMETLNL